MEKFARSLRSLFAVVGIALAIAAYSANCLARTDPGVLVVGQVAEPKSMDPAVVTTANDFRILVNVFDGLTRFKSGTLSVKPGLATSWQLSDGGKRYTFKLREGVRFHDGTVFDAAAVKFNFDRMLDKNHPQHHTGPFPLSFYFSVVKQVTVLDPYTVAFELDAPFAPFLSNLAYPTGLMVSPAAVRQHGKDFGLHPVGTGAFEFVEWRAKRRVVVDRFEGYWGKNAKLDSVIFRPILDANTRIDEMLSGGVDMILEVPPAYVSHFELDIFTLEQQVGPHLWFLILNTQEGPFVDKRVRQAVNYAIDKQAIVDGILKGTAEVAAGPTPPAFAWAYNDELSAYPYSPAKARSLLREAGAEGAELTFYLTEGGSGMLDPVAMGAAIQANLKTVGLKVNIETFEWNNYLEQVNAGLAGKADMAEMAWMTSDPDTLPYLALRTAAWPDKGGFNSGYYSNARVDELLDRARSSSSQNERAALYKEMQAIVAEDAPWVFVANWKQNAVTSDRVYGFSLEPSFLLQLQSVRKE